ncbi:DUF1992 domain-containing protein [Streptomyces catenulae]|uniref:DnaJ family domain-containing protein n=1 Tax=Streptomyces catenulae TaxID=66875 RepID=UPI000996F957|nr:DUF1992 domain-containing protein [Streptomyces catenulae]
MTERKPPGVDFESWIDRQIREAQERGDFAGLPGVGKPLPGLDRPYDELWWVKEKMAREDLSFLPPSLALRKEAEEAAQAAADAPSEAAPAAPPPPHPRPRRRGGACTRTDQRVQGHSESPCSS